MVKVTFSDEELELIKKNAELTSFYGASRVRHQKEERMKMMDVDQMTGQLGEAALSKYITGDIDLYLRTRDERNKNPYEGDGGSDLLGLNVDVKTSQARYGKNFNYHLWVRPHEYHPETVYVFALIYPDEPTTVVLIGWIRGENIGWRKNKYEAGIEELHKLGVRNGSSV